MSPPDEQSEAEAAIASFREWADRILEHYAPPPREPARVFISEDVAACGSEEMQ